MPVNSLNEGNSRMAEPVATRENVPYEIAFWMCVVAFLMLVFYVKITEVLEFCSSRRIL